MTQTAIIIDDDEKSVQTLQILLTCLHVAVKIVGTATQMLDGLKLFKHKDPGIVFFNSSLQHMNGLDFLELAYHPDTYFISLNEHEKNSIPLRRNPIHDCLLKPVTAEDLKTCMEKAIYYLHTRQTFHAPEEQGMKIAIHTGTGTLFKDISDILYIRARSRYSEIFCKDGNSYLVCKNIGEYEADLYRKKFFRIHKSFLVNCSHVIKVNHLDGGFIEMWGGMEIEISRRRKNDFIQFMSS